MQPQKSILSACISAALPLMDADTANEEVIRLHEQIGKLESELNRLRAMLNPLHFITAPEVMLYLKNFTSQLVSSIERDCVRITVAALKQLQDNPQAIAWWTCRKETEEGNG